MTAIQASLHLRELLQSTYRPAWAGLAGRPVAGDDLHAASICLVIVRGQHPRIGDAAATVAARRLKDLVGRALHRQPDKVVLTHPTLDLFVRGFDMSTSDDRRLHGLLAARGAALPLTTRGAVGSLWPRKRYETVVVVEEHEVGVDRSPVAHYTTHTLRALEDGVDTHVYLFDTNALLVEVQEGGHPRHSAPREVADGLYAVDIALDHVLKRGESTTIKYASRFAYPSPPPPEFRRGSTDVMKSVAIRVSFDARAVPRDLYASEWVNRDGPPQNSRRVLPVDGVVERFDERVENSLVGFWWSWG